MNWLKPVFFMTFFLGLLSGLQAEEELSWYSNYEGALAEAKKSGRPILLTFR